MTPVVAPSGTPDAGDEITYSFSVENTGNVALTNVVVTDPMLPTLSCTIANLAIGATTSCTATNNVYTLLVSDITAAHRDNTATATSAEGASDDDDYDVLFYQPPALEGLTKTGVLDDTVVAPSGTPDAGDEITYSFSVENTGNVALTNVVVTDPMLPTLSCTIANLAIGATTSCTATNNVYTLLVSDITAAHRDNTATATSAEGASDDDDYDVLLPAPALELTKTGVLDDTVVAPSGTPDAGDEITYSFSVENTGNVALTNVVVTDPMLPTLSCTIANLAIGATTSCTATNNVYTLLVSDITAAHRDNTATATSAEGASDDDDYDVLLPAPALELTKTGVLDDTVVAPSGTPDAGDEITYSFSVENTGNVALTNVVVTDPMLPTLSCTIANLAIGTGRTV